MMRQSVEWDPISEIDLRLPRSSHHKKKFPPFDGHGWCDEEMEDGNNEITGNGQVEVTVLAAVQSNSVGRAHF